MPKLRLVGDTESVPAAVPVPDIGIVRVESEPFDNTDKLPLAAPAVLGAKVAVKVTLWLGASVMGSVSPEMENIAPFRFAWEIVTLDPPVLVSASDKLELLPAWTFPNARLGGFAASAPCVTPVPESGILKFESEPVEVMFRLPLTAPLAAGVNNIVNEVLCPEVSVIGKLSPLRLNPAPLAVAAEIVRFEPPELVSVSDKPALLPT
ncbi:MAG: hypothetical protein WB817_16460 [Terriglobales bacterium]